MIHWKDEACGKLIRNVRPSDSESTSRETPLGVSPSPKAH